MNTAKTFGMAFLIGLGLAVLSGPSAAADGRPDSVWAIIKNTKELSKFADLASSAGVEGELKATDKAVTVFAPSNSAIDDIPSDVMKKIKADKANMRSYVMYHTVLGSAVFTDSIRNRRASPSTGNGEMIGFDGMGKELVVGDTVITTADLGAKNGVVHIMKGPLVPLSLNDKAQQKLKESQDAEQKKMEEEMERRNKEMEAERAKQMPAEEPKKPSATEPKQPVVDGASAPAAPAAPAMPSAPAQPEKKEEKGLLKKLFSF